MVYGKLFFLKTASKKAKIFWVPKKTLLSPSRGSPKISKKELFSRHLFTVWHGSVRNGQDTNNAIKPLLEKHAKKCYLTWQYIDMNDGKLPQDDLKTFDDWKQSSGCISTSVGSYPRMTYPSPTFHTTVFALSGVVIWRFRVDISRSVNINTLTSRLCVTPSTPS